jgi:hypothetical protein
MELVLVFCRFFFGYFAIIGVMVRGDSLGISSLWISFPRSFPASFTSDNRFLPFFSPVALPPFSLSDTRGVVVAAQHHGFSPFPISFPPTPNTLVSTRHPIDLTKLGISWIYFLLCFALSL